MKREIEIKGCKSCPLLVRKVQGYFSAYYCDQGNGKESLYKPGLIRPIMVKTAEGKCRRPWWCPLFK